MAKLRMHNQLVETSEEELSNLAAKTGAPVPTSPAGAAAVGANPDQAKMAGSGQQRFVNVQPKPAQTLQQDDRRDQARQQMTQSEVAVAAKAGQMDRLSGLDDRVKALVNQQFANVHQQQPSGPIFNQALLDASPAEDKDALTTLLQQYHQLSSADPANPQINEVLAQLSNQYGITNPDEYFASADVVTSQQAADAIVNPEDVKLGTLDLSPLGFTPEQLQEVIGPDYADLSIAQLSQRIQDIRAQEMSRVQTLQAQLRALPPGSAQRQVILDQLRDLGQVGVTGLEQGMEQLQAQIDSADQVTFAGRTYSVGDLLADDNVSEIVSEYFNESADPAWKERLRQENPEFVQWMDTNAESLASLSQSMKDSQKGFQTIQEEQKQLATVGDQTLSDAVMAEIVPGWGDSVASVTDLSGNAIYQAIQANPELINVLNGDPKLAKQLQGMDADQIQSAFQAGKDLMDPVLSALVGVDGGAPFITDEATLQKLSQFKPILDELRERGGQSVKDLDRYLNDPDFQEMITSGRLNEENIDSFLKNPRKSLKEWEEWNEVQKAFDDMRDDGDLDSAINFLFGLDSDAINKQYQSLLSAARDPRNTDAAKALKLLQSYDPTPKDGKFTDKDAKGLIDKITKGLGSYELGGDFTDFRNAVRKGVQNYDSDAAGESIAFMNMIEKGLKKHKGTLGYDFLSEKTPEELDQILAMPAEWKKKHLDPKFDTKKEINAYTKKKDAEKIRQENLKYATKAANILIDDKRFYLDKLPGLKGSKFHRDDINELFQKEAVLLQKLKNPAALPNKEHEEQYRKALKEIQRIKGEFVKAKKARLDQVTKSRDAAFESTYELIPIIDNLKKKLSGYLTGGDKQREQIEAQIKQLTSQHQKAVEQYKKDADLVKWLQQELKGL